MEYAHLISVYTRQYNQCVHLLNNITVYTWCIAVQATNKNCADSWHSEEPVTLLNGTLAQWDNLEAEFTGSFLSNSNFFDVLTGACLHLVCHDDRLHLCPESARQDDPVH